MLVVELEEQQSDKKKIIFIPDNFGENAALSTVKKFEMELAQEKAVTEESVFLLFVY